MEKLVETIARALVDEPESVIVKKTETEEGINIALSVAKDDMGKVIGKKGRIAKAIRTVVNAAATKEEQRVNVEIV